MQYRREIDGLRAVAVVPVILFHAGFEIFRGGFIGVDVFFVISGYLITSVIMSDLEQGKFSLLHFYERRARRILPALYFVTLCCVPFAWMWMLPLQFEDFSKSLVAVALFVSNILFWRESGYFQAEAATKPLLHTWSLAVEEQYYMLFPIFLILLWRFGRKPAFYCITAIAVISLLLSEWGWRNQESANFFLAPTRAWELFAGSICAFLISGRVQRSSNTLSALGLGLILFGIFYYDEVTPFPSLFALVPVIGTVLIILFAKEGTWTARLLSTRVLVGLGLVSYSAYLWHQPLFAFARLRSLYVNEVWLLSLISVLSFALAYFSWRFVERPFRSKSTSVLSSRSVIFGSSASIGVVIVLLGLTGFNAVTPRTAILRPDLMKTYESVKTIGKACEGFTSIEGEALCVRYGDGDHRVVIWGDSHAISLKRGIRPEPGLSVFVISHGGCPPIVHIKRHDRIGNAENCTLTNTIEKYAEFIEMLDPSEVFLMGRWTLYLRGYHKNGRLQAASHFIVDSDHDYVNAEVSKRTFVSRMRETLDFLSSFSSVFIVMPPPDLGNFKHDGRFLSDRGLFFLDKVPVSYVDEWHSVERSVFQELAETTDFSIVDTKDLICNAEECSMRNDGFRNYIDDNHFSGFAAEKQWDMIIDAVHGAR